MRQKVKVFGTLQTNLKGPTCILASTRLFAACLLVSPNFEYVRISKARFLDMVAMDFVEPAAWATFVCHLLGMFYCACHWFCARHWFCVKSLCMVLFVGFACLFLVLWPGVPNQISNLCHKYSMILRWCHEHFVDVHSTIYFLQPKF